jgi:hypothetical protein
LGDGFNDVVVALMQELVVNFQAELVVLLLKREKILYNVIDSDLNAFEPALALRGSRLLDIAAFRARYRRKHRLRQDFELQPPSGRIGWLVQGSLTDVDRCVVFRNKKHRLDVEIFFRGGVLGKKSGRLTRFLEVFNKILNQIPRPTPQSLVKLKLNANSFAGLYFESDQIKPDIVNLFDHWEFYLSSTIRSFGYLKNFYLSFLVARKDKDGFSFQHFPLTKTRNKIRRKRLNRNALKRIRFRWQPQDYRAGFSVFTSITRCPDFYQNWRAYTQANYPKKWKDFERKVFEGRNAIYVPIVFDGYASPIVQITTNEVPRRAGALRALCNLIMDVSVVPAAVWLPLLKTPDETSPFLQRILPAFTA